MLTLRDDSVRQPSLASLSTARPPQGAHETTALEAVRRAAMLSVALPPASMSAAVLPEMCCLWGRDSFGDVHARPARLSHVRGPRRSQNRRLCIQFAAPEREPFWFPELGRILAPQFLIEKGTKKYGPKSGTLLVPKTGPHSGPSISFLVPSRMPFLGGLTCLLVAPSVACRAPLPRQAVAKSNVHCSACVTEGHTFDRMSRGLAAAGGRSVSKAARLTSEGRARSDQNSPQRSPPAIFGVTCRPRFWYRKWTWLFDTEANRAVSSGQHRGDLAAEACHFHLKLHPRQELYRKAPLKRNPQ